MASLKVEMESEASAPDSLVRERDLARRIEAEIQSLPPKMRAVFELSRKEHKSYKEISDYLNISDKTVKKQVNNALHILRTKLTSLLMFF